MKFLRPTNTRSIRILLGFVFLLSYTIIQAQEGKTIFQANCATCHAIDKDLTGPALRGVNERGPWTNRANLIKWVHNPGAFIPTTPYTTQLAASRNGQI